MRAALLFFVCACGSGAQPLPPASPDASSADASLDAAALTDAEVLAADAGVFLDAAPIADATPGPDAGTPPVDCAAIAARWQLCSQSEQSCAAVFEDGAGCAAVCAAAGLTCAAAYENLDNECAPDESRPQTTCDSGHGSDYCVCTSDVCIPNCTGKVCGDDGCGNACGQCSAGEVCQDGQCGSGEDCTRYPFSPDTLWAEKLGFGRNARGGDPNRVYRVTTLANDGAGSLRRALESTEPYWIVFDVEGVITHPERVRMTSNKTIDGRGRDIEIVGHLELRDAQNIIISDVKMSNPLEGYCTQAGDVVTVSGRGGADPNSYSSRNIWFHHVEFYNGGDGLLDIRGGSQITVSWSHFHTHKKGILAGPNNDDSPSTGMTVTWHHNYFDRISYRGPQFRQGRAHYFNNYQYEFFYYGAGSLTGAQLYSENNVYQARPGRVCVIPCQDPNPCGDQEWLVYKDAIVTDWDTNGLGYAQSVGDLLENDAVVNLNEPSRVFDPAQEYSYVAEPADQTLKDRVRDGAGPRTNYCR